MLSGALRSHATSSSTWMMNVVAVFCRRRHDATALSPRKQRRSTEETNSEHSTTERSADVSVGNLMLHCCQLSELIIRF